MHRYREETSEETSDYLITKKLVITYLERRGEGQD